MSNEPKMTSPAADFETISKAVETFSQETVIFGPTELYLKERVRGLFNADIPVEQVQEYCRYLLNNIEPGLPEERINKKVKAIYNGLRSTSGPFWKIISKEKNESAIISSVELRDFLKERGLAKYYIDNDYCFIIIKDNKVKEITPPQIKDYVVDYVENSGIENKYVKMLIGKLIDNQKHLNIGSLEYLPPKDLLFKRDKEDEAYFFYRNGFVTVSKDSGIKFQEYKDFTDYIWESQIIDRDFKLLDGTALKSDFEQFIRNVSKGDEGRFNTICSAIGYLLHSFKDSANAKSIVLCDEKISDNPNGRTGKSLIGKAVSKIRSSVTEDGKTFNFTDKFAYQKVELATQILEFNDVTKNFSFEKLFSVITDSLTVEKKGQQAYRIPFERSPKILISTNYTIKGSSDSFKARLFEIELSDYYSADHQPIDDFKKMFFNGWNDDEWNQFDNFMLNCTKLYLDKGLIEYTPINILKRKVLALLKPEFVEFMEENIKFGEKYEKPEVISEFKLEYPENGKIAPNAFSIWLKKYCETMDLELKEWKSNSSQYFTISDKVKIQGGKVIST